ncbi:porin [Gluconobacter wancherniae]|uniref:porin n=1 Tax=Gluconobacter wancherniae TaxID=1307955 RepID=UPI001B8D9EFA|nr:porin [Gluconobacter wancherniae]MBS1063207.1 porin [Gluconobacter wancherniae]
MSLKLRHRLGLLGSIVCLGTVGVAQSAQADDYTELLDILRAKGSLTRGEYNGLLAHHLHRTHTAPDVQQSSYRKSPSGRSRSSRNANYGDSSLDAPDVTTIAAASAARRAAADAEASARSAQSTLFRAQHDYDPASIVRVKPYVAGKGVTIQAGQIDINLSGFINGYYTFNGAGSGSPVAGGVSTGSTGFDSSAVRNGLLPGGLILKLNTTQDGIDLGAVFGMYPGINNADVGTFNANSGGSPVGLGTAGLDFRQVYMTAGTKDLGTIKIGRDIALFAADAILNDATLLSVGSTGSNANPANTSLGRIGVGYVYTDWLPQITYISPKWHGLQGSIGVMTPLDEFNYAGGGRSAVSSQHSSPMVQGKVTYDATIEGFTARFWSSFLIQHQQSLTSNALSDNSKHSAMVEAGDVGMKLTKGPFEGVAYYYYGSGLGTTGLFFDGVATNGRKRNSEGYYVQGAYKILPRLKIVGSYGVSNLYSAAGEVYDPLMVRRNESEVGALYYNLTDWMTIVGEYAHTKSDSHGPNKEDDSTISAGAMMTF